MFTICCLIVIPYARIWYAYVKGQRHLARLKSMVKIQFWYWGQRSRSYRVQDTSYHGDTLTCQTKYDYVTGQKSGVLNTKPYVINPINLTMRSKVNVVSWSWMYLTHPLMVIDTCAKYGMPMSKLTEVTGQTWRHEKSL